MYSPRARNGEKITIGEVRITMKLQVGYANYI